jgi:hypothetical protein
MKNKNIINQNFPRNTRKSSSKQTHPPPKNRINKSEKLEQHVAIRKTHTQKFSKIRSNMKFQYLYIVTKEKIWISIKNVSPAIRRLF